MPARRIRIAIGLAAALAAEAHAAEADFPTTAFADGAKSATVTAGPVTAGISMVLRPDVDPDFEVPILTVMVDGASVLEVAGVASGLDFPATEASIAEIDPDNGLPEVYFTSYSGGAHCCTMAVVAEEVDGRWVAVGLGEFDGDGRMLTDLDGDGIAELATVDNRFLYQFDCYACSAAPLSILTVRGGQAYDVSTDPRFLPAHRDWLERIEASADPAEQWQSPGYLAGWVAAKIRVGEGAEAWEQLNANWDSANDPGEEVCLSGEEPETCPRRNLAVLKFPERLMRFLEQSGYNF